MKNAHLKRILLAVLILCLISTMAGCSILRGNSKDKNGEESTDQAEVGDTTGKIEIPSVESSIVIDPADEESVEKLTEEQKEELDVLLANMKDELTEKLSELGIDLDIDARTCEVSLPASILFPGDSAELSQKGKEFLAEYVTLYNQAVLNSQYNKYVGYIMIEGHTAPLKDSTYESGLPLSRDRANAVREFILSEDAGTSKEDAVKLGYLLVAEGCSNSRPVYLADGSVDLAASRRVTFRVLFCIPQDDN